MRKSQQCFWQGLGIGLVAGSAAGVMAALLRSTQALTHGPIRRVERSVQIGRPLEEIYGMLLHPERLIGLLPELEGVRVDGREQWWRLRDAAGSLEWCSEITQILPHQAIGWKSRTGPKHTGRVTLARLGEDTELHVVMNYAPAGRSEQIADTVTDRVGHLVDDLLTHLKQSLEGKGFDATGTAHRRPPIAVAPPAPAPVSESA